MLTFKDNRISTEAVLKHSWLHNIERLKQYEGANQNTKNLWSASTSDCRISIATSIFFIWYIRLQSDGDAVEDKSGDS